eukprot:6209148-Pleurochrysis_carterae.AAC.3
MGYAGNCEPSFIVPSVIATKDPQKVRRDWKGVEDMDFWIGDEALARSNEYSAHYLPALLALRTQLAGFDSTWYCVCNLLLRSLTRGAIIRNACKLDETTLTLPTPHALLCQPNGLARHCLRARHFLSPQL